MSTPPASVSQELVSLERGGAPPPFNLEAEQAVLSAILLSDRALYGLIIGAGLQPEDFYREQHARIYEAMLALHDAAEPVDVVTVKERLRATGKLDEAGGEATVEALAGAAPMAGNARHYAGIVKENALLRRLLRTSYDIQSSVHGREASPRELVEQAERAILDVAHDDRQKAFRSVSDILAEEVHKLERLSREHTSLTGTPSGFRHLDDLTGGFQPGNLIVLAARPSMGKCLPGDALVHDPTTGRRRRMDEVVADVERGEPVWVASMGPDMRLRATRVAAAERNGRRPLLHLRTRLGRAVRATANHPVLTIEGWRRIDELQLGARIAVPRRLPAITSPASLPDHEIVLLAALIADGNLTQHTPRFCFGRRSAVADEVRRGAEAAGVRLNTGPQGWGTATLSAGRGARSNPVRAMCERHGLWGLGSAEKHVPGAIHLLDDLGIRRFLSILYACDGHVHASGRLRQIGYTTISPRLARDVQHLLLRLGVVAKVRPLRRPVYEGTDVVAREVLITGREDVEQFCSLVPVVGKAERIAAAVAQLRDVVFRTNVDTLPREAWAIAAAAKGERPWADVSAAAGRPRNHNWQVGSRGMSRPLAAEIGAALGDARLNRLATSDLWWDEVVAIEPAGEEETYDLDVPGDRSFVADDVLVHNSALVTNIAENAALHRDGPRPVALFSLEMSEAELAQRFVASQSLTPGEQLRKGRVAPERWPKILEACNKLAAAPLYVDDSSDIGILEVRAKARRLHQQHRAEGGLGLIIVDYLQLMRADHRVESRVEQVGQMSRGLKILARELDVPVIALSQLSRAVEQRNDKRPILSDLRESGQIEQDADLVMFIYRDEYYERESEREGIADIIVAKHRNGALGDVQLTFRKQYPKFMNYQAPT